MSAFSKAFLAAVIVVGSVATASATSMRTFYDDSGRWHVQDQSGVWPKYPGSGTASPLLYVPPFTFQEPFTFREQERLDMVQGHIA
jgi:hypothetical protein